MKTLDTNVNHHWAFSTWFVALSPLLGVVFGFVGLLIFAR
jgi:hypothetical protein